MNRSLSIRFPVAVVLIIAVLVLVLAVTLAAVGDDELSIRQTTEGNATIVAITGPRKLLDRVAEVAALRHRVSQHPSLGQSPCGPVWEAPGFVIAWGDGTSSPFSAVVLPAAPGGCPDPLSHAYAVPGTYTVVAYTHHLGPADGTIVDWRREISISVGGAPPPLGLSVIAPLRDKRHYFNEPIIVRWKLSTPERVDLLAEIVGQDGAILGRASLENLKYADEGGARINLNEDAYAQHLLDETAPVVARVRLQEQGREVLVSDSEPFYLTARLDDGPADFARAQATLLPGTARSISLRHHPDTASCHVYRIDWGDGSPPEQREAGCSQRQQPIETPHTYWQAGHYRIVLRTTNRGGKADLSLDNAPYQVLEIDVP